MNVCFQIPLYCHCDALFRELASRHKTTVMKKLAEALCNTAMKSDGDGGGADAMETVLSSVTVLYQSGDSKASLGLPFKTFQVRSSQLDQLVNCHKFPLS